ncbi:hypothetical protein RRG08_009912 [Elysia crispata]|uniref:Uncharacterized protein n=1 Tax=Elysia crispata TaxID=231223 RepID=A0AAE1E4H6_9GAST|nr:hypothetical protein RRG08_009912 [Elysia crispata]
MASNRERATSPHDPAAQFPRWLPCRARRESRHPTDSISDGNSQMVGQRKRKRIRGRWDDCDEDIETLRQKEERQGGKQKRRGALRAGCRHVPGRQPVSRRTFRCQVWRNWLDVAAKIRINLASGWFPRLAGLGRGKVLRKDRWSYAGDLVRIFTAGQLPGPGLELLGEFAVMTSPVQFSENLGS